MRSVKFVSSTSTRVKPTEEAESPDSTPRVDVYRATDQTVVGGSVPAKVLFDTEAEDSDDTFDVSTSLWTPGVAGRYQIHAGVEIETAAGQDLALQVWVSGVLKRELFRFNPRNVSTATLPGSCFLTLSDSDTVGIYVVNGYSNTRNIQGGESSAWFQGYQIA